MDTKQIIERAGGARAVAEALGCSPKAVYAWIYRGGMIPAIRVARISEMAGVSPHEIRPDVFPSSTQ